MKAAMSLVVHSVLSPANFLTSSATFSDVHSATVAEDVRFAGVVEIGFRAQFWGRCRTLVQWNWFELCQRLTVLGQRTFSAAFRNLSACLFHPSGNESLQFLLVFSRFRTKHDCMLMRVGAKAKVSHEFIWIFLSASSDYMRRKISKILQPLSGGKISTVTLDLP